MPEKYRTILVTYFFSIQTSIGSIINYTLSIIYNIAVEVLNFYQEIVVEVARPEEI